MKTVKLNKNQLRNLISEAIQTREPGSPLFTPPEVDEALSDRIPTTGPPTDEIGNVLNVVEKMLLEYFMNQFNHDDPTHNAGGVDVWKEQVDIAVDAILGALENSIDDVETSLHNGEYYR